MNDAEKRAGVRDWLAKRIADVADQVEANRLAQGRAGIMHLDPSAGMRAISSLVEPDPDALLARMATGAWQGGKKVVGTAVAPGSGPVWEGIHNQLADLPRLPMLMLALGTPAVALATQKAHQDSMLLGPLYEAQQLGETPMSQDTYYNFTQRRKHAAVQEKTAAAGPQGARTMFGAGADAINDILKKVLYKDVSKEVLDPKTNQMVKKTISELSMPRAIGAAGAGLAGLTALDVMGEPVVDSLQQSLFPGYNQEQLEQKALQSFSQEAGKQTAQMAGDMVRALGTMGAGAVRAVPASQAQRATFGLALKTDPLLQQATPEEQATLERAFQSMVRFAPELATDEFAVKNYLRESLMSAAGGPDYGTLSNLGRASQMLQGGR